MVFFAGFLGFSLNVATVFATFLAFIGLCRILPVTGPSFGQFPAQCFCAGERIATGCGPSRTPVPTVLALAAKTVGASIARPLVR